jgi:hypothetical protein
MHTELMNAPGCNAGEVSCQQLAMLDCRPGLDQAAMLRQLCGVNTSRLDHMQSNPTRPATDLLPAGCSPAHVVGLPVGPGDEAQLT